jgi:hypothetical protein
MSQQRQHDAFVVIATGTPDNDEPGILRVVGLWRRGDANAQRSGRAPTEKGGTMPSTGGAYHPPILLPPFTSGRAIGGHLSTSTRHSRSSCQSHQVDWASQRWAPRSSHPPRWLGSVRREKGVSSSSLCISTPLSSISFISGRDRIKHSLGHQLTA